MWTRADTCTTQVYSGSECKFQWNPFLFFFFQFWSHWVFALAKQWLKLGFRHNVSEATGKDCLEMASSRMLRLTDVHCLRAFPAPLLYLAGFHNPLTSKGCVLMVAGREQWKSLPYTHPLEAFQWTSHCIWKCKGFGELHLEQKTKHNYLELPKTYQKFLTAFRRAVREFTWPIFLLFNGKKKWLPKGNIYFFVWEKKIKLRSNSFFRCLSKHASDSDKITEVHIAHENHCDKHQKYFQGKHKDWFWGKKRKNRTNLGTVKHRTK